jgi:DNA-binding NtrC family response regulator
VSKSNSSHNTAGSRKLAILFIDDDIIELEIMDSVVEDLDQTVFSAKGREEAIDIVKRNTIDMAFIDVHIAGDCGFSIAEAVHQLDPGIKIYMKSGDDDTFDEVKKRPFIVNFISKSQDIDKIEYYIKSVYKEKMNGY